MLFRSKDGKLVEINRFTFVNDNLYYAKILRSKSSFTKVNAQLEQIIKVCK
jgi:hypothetical protein